MIDEDIHATAEADAIPDVASDDANDNTDGTAVADAKDPNLAKAIAERQKAKERARTAEARAGELEATVSAMIGDRDSAIAERDKYRTGFERLASAAIDRYLENHVEKRLHAAARTVLRDVDLLTADEKSIISLLNSTGMLPPRGRAPRSAVGMVPGVRDDADAQRSPIG